MLIISGETVHMEPTKEFFINIFTSDIKLDRAILDLIDNSIDAARKANTDLSTYKIRLTLNNKGFMIEDNCDGISKERASNYAFKFGNNEEKNKKEFSIGHFGVGMKRAFFKIGTKIYVESATKQDFFSLIIDVNKWRKSDEWNILFKNSGTNNSSKAIGTKIQIKDLNNEAKSSFVDEDFIENLIGSISTTYKIEIKKGITIVVNGRIVTISTRTNEAEILKYLIDCRNYTAEIIIKKDIPDYKKSGWYIYLNDRLVVGADKTDLTGWDISDDEKYHVLRGYVYAKAKIEGVLPFNTTKEGLDTSNPTYKELKGYMRNTLEESLPKISNNDFATIKYEKPRTEVEKLKKILNVRYYKNIGEITYEEYLKRNNIKL